MKKQNVILFLLLFFCTTVATAQNLPEITVVNFEENPTDMTARNGRYSVKDGNGNLFSIIKLVSVNYGDDLRSYFLEFGNYCEGRREIVDGEVWWYVQCNARHITIKREGYKTKEYGLPVTVHTGQVFELVLSAEALPIYHELLQFNIKPANAKATVMYRSADADAQLQLFGVTDDEGSVAKNMELGVYYYEIHADGYRKSEGRIELKEKNRIHEESVTLRPDSLAKASRPGEKSREVQFRVAPAEAKAVVMYKSTAPGAQLQYFGMTDDKGTAARNLEPGTYVYEIHSDRYHKSEGRIELKDVNETHIENVTLRPNFSAVTLEAGEGIAIYINDERKGTGIWNGELNAGIYSVECRKDKHRSVRENITVADSGKQTIRLKSPTPIVGSLSLISRPRGANIAVDGKEYGMTPATIDSLLIGEHTVTLTKPNYKNEKFTVEITENNVIQKTVTLSNVAQMTITSQPTGAELYIDGKHVGTTPYSAEFTSGDYDLRIVKKKYRDFVGRAHFDSSNPNLGYTLKRQYQKKNAGYVEAAGQAGYFMGAGANAGCYIHNFNIQAHYTFSLTTPTIYLNHSDGSDPDSDDVSALAFGARLGYGIILGSRYRITPQLGVGVLNVMGEQLRANALTASAAVRCECALAGCIGVSLTPEYSLAISKKPVFEKLSSVSSAVKGWGTGFNVRLGVYFYF